MKKILLLILLTHCNAVLALPQTDPVHINQALLDRIKKIEPDNSNAHDIEMMIGEPTACMPVGDTPSEVWMCQWKGDLTSYQFLNTLNITFESGMIAKVVWVDGEGKYRVNS